MKYREKLVVPGGAANAVNNLADLGVNVLPAGIVGNDEAGRLLLKGFRKKHVPVSGILKGPGYATPTKTRILAGMTHSSRQQVVRVDREPDAEPDRNQKREIVLAAREYARASDAVLISDYGYGAATPAILNAIRDKGRLDNLPVVLDSRHRMLQYFGVTAATPNEPEVEEAFLMNIGHDWSQLCSAASQVISRMNLQSLVITRGRDGMVAFSGNQNPVRHSNFWLRPGGRRHWRGRYRDRHIYRRFGCWREHRRSCASGKLCRRDCRHETRHRDGFPRRTAAGD